MILLIGRHNPFLWNSDLSISPKRFRTYVKQCNYYKLDHSAPFAHCLLFFVDAVISSHLFLLSVLSQTIVYLLDGIYFQKVISRLRVRKTGCRSLKIHLF
jgi:hypothetical protein